MFKKIISAALVFVMTLSFAACGSSGSSSSDQEEEKKSGKGKIGIMCATVSQGEEIYRAAEKMAKKYGDQIVLQTYPDNFMKEQETTISNIKAMADDPDIKAIIVCEGIPGTSAAIDKVKESRDDILFIVSSTLEDPPMIASKADLLIQCNDYGMGDTIIEQAHKMGAKNFVHYSFPRHMSMQMLSLRRELMKKNCEKYGMKFVDATCPDPQGDAGVSGTQQFILEDVPRKVSELGKDTAFFGTNSAMQEPMIKRVLETGAIYPQSCDPSPYSGFPGALGIEVPDDKKQDIKYLTDQIKTKIAEKGGSGRFSCWPVPANMLMVEADVEYAMEYINGKTNGKVDEAKVKEVLEKVSGTKMDVSKFKDLSTNQEISNMFVFLSDYITF